MAKTSFKKPPQKAKGAAPATKPAPKKIPAPAPKKTPPGIRSNATAPPPKRTARPVEATIVEEQEEQQTPPPPTSKAVVPRRGAAPAVRQPGHKLGMPIGQLDASDQDMPMLKIAQGGEGSSPLIDAGFPEGDWVLAGEATVWSEGWDPLDVTVVRFEKLFMQQLDFGSAEMPLLFKTADQAQAAGLVPFGGHEVGYVAYAEAVCLIKHPPYEIETIDGNKCEQFTEECGDDSFAIAMWRITGTAYKWGARKLVSNLRTRLRDTGFLGGSFQINARKEKGKMRTYWVPQVREGTMHEEAMLEFATEIAARYDVALPQDPE